MMAKTGLLVVSNPKHINKLLSNVQNKVNNTLYIQLLSALGEPLGSFYPNLFSGPPKFSKTVHRIYSQAIHQCNHLDVRVLLTGLKCNVPKIQTQNSIDIVIFDKKYSQNEIDTFIKSRISNLSSKFNTLTVDCGEREEVDREIDNRDSELSKHVCLGGTFDRLHVAHKVLLSDAILRASEKVTIGVTEENMIHKKLLWELIEDTDTRLNNVTNFVTDICPEITYNICKISDPFGPAIEDPTMDMIVVSEETIKGGEVINQIRKEKSLSELKIVPILLIDEPNPQVHEEKKVSSANGRLRLLGTLLNPIEKKDIPEQPYVIGLTGGIASGKSGVANHLESLSVPIINCDLLGHKMYEKDSGTCYKKVVDEFGCQVLKSDGEIDRRKLGQLVFKNPAELKKLTDILWPSMAELLKANIETLRCEGIKIVCVEAAVLCQAGWDNFCHEIWTTFVPREEAIKRLIERNKLTEEDANERLTSQPTNQEYISQANVVFCPYWEVEYTKRQVLRAWDLLQKRLQNATS